MRIISYELEFDISEWLRTYSKEINITIGICEKKIVVDESQIRNVLTIYYTDNYCDYPAINKRIIEKMKDYGIRFVRMDSNVCIGDIIRELHFYV